MNCQFPVTGATTSPFFNDPYKMLAATPLTLLFWRTVQMAGNLRDFEGRGFFAVHCALLLAHSCLNYRMVEQSMRLKFAPRLFDAMTGAVAILTINFLDVALLNEFNKYAEGGVVVVRVAIIAFSIYALLFLVSEANKDRVL